MSSSSFIGLPVLLSLHTGCHLRGVVQSINAVQGTIILSSCHLFQPGQETDKEEEEGEYLGTRAVERAMVRGLEVVSVSRGNGEQRQPTSSSSYAQPSQPTYDSLPTTSPLYTSSSNSPAPRKQRRNGGGGRKLKQYGGETGNEGDGDESTAAGGAVGWEEDGRASRGDGTRRRHPPHPTSYHQQQQSYSPQPQAYHHSQQPEPQQQQQPNFDQEFDFGAGLRSFDKRRVFEEIRAQDLTDPSSLLVSHNRSSSSPHPHSSNPKMTKMKPTESVLSPRELEQQEEEGRRAFEKLAMFGREGEQGESGEGGEGEGSGEEEEEEEGMQTAPEHEDDDDAAEEGEGEGEGQGAWVSKKEGRRLVVVSRREWEEVVGVADIESLPSPSTRLSTAAHSLTCYILSLPTTPTTSVLLLINAPAKGELALRAGVHLLNRGWRVTAWVAKGVKGEGVREGLRVFSTSSGRIVRSLADLAASYDLLIDALSDDEEEGEGRLSLSAEELAAGRWVNEREPEGAQVVCIDCPWGRGRESGAPLTPSPLTPTHLLSLGALRQCSTSLSSLLSSGRSPKLELAVLDVGIPPHLWARCGVQGFESSTSAGESQGGGGALERARWEEGWWVGVVQSRR